ncbi:hypothetical protein [Ruegeria arenilitoris]|uniref:hypothetical protein n=1 Tax=Ruegeria arenilitoris TaxID=1173585 RepID=UPI00147C7C0D|nr:hypothetical protein [Ruegeria arenilitoris]
MPNVIAYIVLFSWPLVVVVLFKVLEKPSAISASIIAGYLLLPGLPQIDLPILPVLDKTLIPALSATIMCLLIRPPKPTWGSGSYNSPDHLNRPASNRKSKQESAGARLVLILLLLVLFASGFATVLTNGEALQFGPLSLPGMRVYDGFSIGLETLVSILPFFLGARYLATESGHKVLLVALAMSGLAYSLLALFEVRMSPQLNLWIYGYFPHDFSQHVRGGGFRPIVFLQHGLWVSIFLSMATLSGAALLRSSSLAATDSFRWMLFLGWMLITMVLVKSLGALVITVLLMPLIMFGTNRLMLRAASVVALIVLTYPMLRGLDWVPVESVSELAAQISPRRAESFDVRVASEDVLLARAEEKPFFGWGGWGRNEGYDPETGAYSAITDGMWVIFVGMFGWFGYVARFGLLTLPLLTLHRRKKKQDIPLATAGLTLVSAANLIDLIPNATLTPVTWLIAGSLTGYVLRAHVNTSSDIKKSESFNTDRAIESSQPNPINVRKPRT